ncbi:SDR family oxidoreductase [Paenibacillus herberti]|uniref:NmrA-like domain-containing protein n=1 Tax=Paenibacillus herberti TaxID=1619309 RepID=A0A229NUI9_9BACL|nr:NmrA family NAD(P)-binding protein [Paenibacillus herberti]OXM13546.1 hypothetical protein CGZ75_21160 [Paenibacillus herberti]
MTKKQVLVYGASGVQGGAVAQKLIEGGYEVHALARSNEKAEQLRSAGINPVIGDLDNVQSLAKAHEAATIVYLQLPVLFNSTAVSRFIQHAVDAAKAAQTELLVVNTNVFVPEQATDTTALKLKRQLKDAVVQSGLPYIFLQPTLYLENLCLPGILQGNVLAYPVPAQMPISWISIEDAAKYAVYAIEHPELAGQTVQVHAPDAVTGDQLAELFSKALGRPVNFHSLATTDFEAALTPFLGAETSAGLAGLYAWIGANGQLMPQPGTSATTISDHVSGTPTAEWVKQAVQNGIFK